MKPVLIPKKKINHVAIIMDGNGRWATKRKKLRKYGHEKGIKNCISICNNLSKLNYKIDEISFYVFSTENWNRSVSEVNNLFRLIESFYNEFKDIANKNNLRIRHYGSRNKLSKKILKIIDDVIEKTENNRGICVNLLFNYGSRQEISDAISKIKKIGKSKVDLRKYLYVPESNDPELIIRTGGQIRLSNFMLWQSAYSELIFLKILWPDFRISNLNSSIDEFFRRKRNHGK